ncbi:guanylate kinase [Hyphomicrobium sp. CS1BSMeth3]|uniref:guanylate kinase n=1 Tax=Hyphomicrobium sp. CS1BSMeth3 TaxID=1892844 RepID=UPI000930D5B4|nr:guanylate kinase [Hyphomicrobium sp. CS1BSMeth3]
MASTHMARRGVMLVLSSPSGAGKTTLAKALLAAEPALVISVSVTTRKPRPGEVDGQDYHFIDAAAFERLKEAGELLEWAHVHGNLYGTPRGPVMDALNAGRDVLFDIDWQGAQQLAETAPADLVRVFVLPPSAAALGQRLHARAQDGADVVARRLAAAGEEISHWPEYDYVVVNDVVAESLSILRGVLSAERHRSSRQTGLPAFARELQQGLKSKS